MSGDARSGVSRGFTRIEIEGIIKRGTTIEQMQRILDMGIECKLRRPTLINIVRVLRRTRRNAIDLPMSYNRGPMMVFIEAALALPPLTVDTGAAEDGRRATHRRRPTHQAGTVPPPERSAHTTTTTTTTTMTGEHDRTQMSSERTTFGPDKMLADVDDDTWRSVHRPFRSVTTCLARARMEDARSIVFNVPDAALADDASCVTLRVRRHSDRHVRAPPSVGISAVICNGRFAFHAKDGHAVFEPVRVPVRALVGGQNSVEVTVAVAEHVDCRAERNDVVIIVELCRETSIEALVEYCVRRSDRFERFGVPIGATCEVCSSDRDLLPCAHGCGRAFYCSVWHAMRHWLLHETTCAPSPRLTTDAPSHPTTPFKMCVPPPLPPLPPPPMPPQYVEVPMSAGRTRTGTMYPVLCAISGRIIDVPARSKTCVHIDAVDLRTHLSRDSVGVGNHGGAHVDKCHICGEPMDVRAILVDLAMLRAINAVRGAATQGRRVTHLFVHTCGDVEPYDLSTFAVDTVDSLLAAHPPP